MNEPDPKLIKQCLRQDRRAQERLYKLCFGVLIGICGRYYRNQDEAVAAMNLGFLKVLKNLDRKSPDVPFKAWISRIMINTIIDEYRTTRTYRERILSVDFTEPHEEPVRTQLNDAEKQLDAEDAARLLLQLPPTTRQVFNLFAIDGYSHAEVSSMMGISVGTSKWHVASARKQLLAWIKRHKPYLIPSPAANES